MGIASLVLGIIALVIVVLPLLPDVVGIVLGLAGIVLGAIGKKKDAKNATAGLVLSIIATIVGVIFYIACAACVSGLAGSL